MLIDFYFRRLQQMLLSRQRLRASVAEISADCNSVVFFIDHELARTQIYPLVLYGRQLRRQNDLRLNLVPTQALLDAPAGAAAPQVKRVFVQAPLNADAAAVEALMQAVRRACPEAAICYLDWMAPIDVRHAGVLDPYIDSYITKQTFSDPARFHAEFVGDSNLSDHYFRRMGKPMPSVRYAFPAGFERKLILGSNFGFSPQMLDMFRRRFPGQGQRDIGLHARIATKGVDWYQHMREEALQAALAVRAAGVNCVIEGRVRRPAFFAEMRRSQLCYSPFGYGEVCWRDYEAFATGAVLLKPDMGHLRTFPEVFRPGETYVALRWDSSDLLPQVQHWLADALARQRMSEAAFELMHQHVRREEPRLPFEQVLALHPL